jgi:hypothetical protein
MNKATRTGAEGAGIETMTTDSISERRGGRRNMRIISIRTRLNTPGGIRDKIETRMSLKLWSEMTSSMYSRKTNGETKSRRGIIRGNSRSLPFNRK